MKMLEADESDVDAQVTEPDQTNINRFSRLNSRTDELESELEVLNKQVEDVEEVETEMELMDEDELVMYKLDSSFLRLPASEVLTLLQTSLKSLKDRQTTLQDEKTQCETEMDELKAILYAKFGKSINLERGDD